MGLIYEGEETVAHNFPPTDLTDPYDGFGAPWGYYTDLETGLILTAAARLLLDSGRPGSFDSR